MSTVPTPVSAAMIVKNEAARLGAALDSLARLSCVREVVVLDTGSTDGSPDIARERGARVHHGEWHDDFALARNAAADLCAHDWILVLDGDEEVVDGTAIDALFASPDAVARVNGVRVHVENRVPGQTPTYAASLRLYRRDVARWRYPVHNQLVGVTAVADTNAHWLAWSDEPPTEASRQRRFAVLLQQALRPENSPDRDRGAALHYAFFITQEMRARGILDGVIEWGERYLSLRPLEDTPCAVVSQWIVEALIAAGQVERACEVLQGALCHHGAFWPLLQLEAGLVLARWACAMADPDGRYGRLESHAPPTPEAFRAATSLLGVEVPIEERGD